jgi:hypothetical protein
MKPGIATVFQIIQILQRMSLVSIDVGALLYGSSVLRHYTLKIDRVVNEHGM